MAQVKPIPEGYRTVTPFLSVNGAREAIAFYKQAFGAEERAIMPGPDGKVMHSEIKIGDSIVMLADAMMGPPAQSVMHSEIKIGDSIVMLADAMMGPPAQSVMHLYVPDVDATWAKATAAGCQVVMPLADQFWGDRYGIVSDKWGNRWSMATHKEDLSPDEMKRRGDEAMKQRKG